MDIGAYQTSFKYWYDVVMVKNGEMHISSL